MTKQLRMEPNQPTTYYGEANFPVTNNRKFLPKWYKLFPWLEYIVELDKAFCHPCRLEKSRTCITTPKSQNEFTNIGLSNWTKAVDILKRHESSAAHSNSLYQFQSIEKGTDVANQLVSYKEEERAWANRCMLQIMSSLRFLVCQGLPLRGHEYADSNLNQLLKLRAEYSKELSDWLKRKTSWLGIKIQDEIVHEMAHTILRSITKEVKDHQIIGVWQMKQPMLV